MKYFMLTGHRKSGTTLLHRLFDGHPGINIYPMDIHLLYAFFPCWSSLDISETKKKERITKVLKESLSDLTGKSLSKKLTSFNPSNFIDIFWEQCGNKIPLKPSLILESLAHAYCNYAMLDKNLPFLFKETSQSVNFQTFIDDGLNIKCIQIIRDPRDNFSAIKAGVKNYYKKINENENESLASLLNRAKLDLQLASELVNEFKEYFYVIRFEDLAKSPISEMKSLINFLEIEWDESLLSPTILNSQYSGNNYQGKRFSGVSKENIGNWPERISSFEAATIEGWMHDEMTRWNYQLTFNKSDQRRAIQEFYSWYNCRYFYNDGFKIKKKFI